MYVPKFTITNEILANIGLIEAAKEVIENAPLIPIYEARFVKEAILRTVHHGTHIEGNDLSLNEAKRVIDGENIVGRERDVQEVINYRRVVDWLEKIAPRQGLEYTQEMLLQINRLAGERIMDAGRAGSLRQTKVVVKNNRTGEIVFQPPPAIEVPFLLEDFFIWLDAESGRRVHPVLRAGIAHYVLVAIHPFAEANGRTARAFATLILYAEGYDIRRFFSLEEYFDKDAARYYQAIGAVDRTAGDLTGRELTTWLEYFTQAMAVELTRVKEKVKQLSLDLKMKGKIGYQIPLNERQMKLMEALQQNGSLTTVEARKVAPEYSDDTLTRDFNYFAKKGIIKKVGKTKAAKYILK
ncbi:hypothetical protein COT65_01540 [Candidatus Shapirobacteria bacterium CG09_land_8_20_14_0_10_47_13]|uniref:Fido domain-containing protein n=1 Tax=Candidatus Shapirobacteria bacterium CG09_land_8_20_14_0_10_47_13 TaxID=1974481 RepID=A0A2H0WMR8_9BACT|nr:MAG: hypothetical protein COT65_01540 [Candidatus Shapirobacteria bacterium CG09_land_8_20_14_0_10_47_13]